MAHRDFSTCGSCLIFTRLQGGRNSLGTYSSSSGWLAVSVGEDCRAFPSSKSAVEILLRQLTERWKENRLVVLWSWPGCKWYSKRDDKQWLEYQSDIKKNAVAKTTRYRARTLSMMMILPMLQTRHSLASGQGSREQGSCEFPRRVQLLNLCHLCCGTTC
jgi:hypothetical protein